MNIRIKYIRSSGEIQNERLVLAMTESGEIGNFLTAVSRYTDSGNSVSTQIKYPFWFPDKQVSKGSTIVVYTKKGRNVEKSNKDGSKSFFFYRGLSEPIFQEEGVCAVVFEIFKWISGDVQKD